MKVEIKNVSDLSLLNRTKYAEVYKAMTKVRPDQAVAVTFGEGENVALARMSIYNGFRAKGVPVSMRVDLEARVLYITKR